MIEDQAAGLAGAPSSPVAVPGVVDELAGGDDVVAVWRNQLGGIAFRVGAGTARDRYVKWAPVGAVGIDLAGESARLRWLARWSSVPEVLDEGTGVDGSWLVTRAIDARSAVDERWADLAVAAWSTEWNYGPGFEPVVYESYGIEPDPARIAYYRLLWDLS